MALFYIKMKRDKEQVTMRLVMSDKPIDVDFQGRSGIKYVDLSSLRIANCTGCFGCWTRTPGRCVIRDDATLVYPDIARSEKVLYISRIKYGGYDSVMKAMLERAIPVQQAFIRIHKGETHHEQRAVVNKDATIIAYEDHEIADEEKAIFRQLVERNANNMSFERVEVFFERTASLNGRIEKVLDRWEKS